MAKKSIAKNLKTEDLKQLKHIIFINNITSQTEYLDFKNVNFLAMKEQSIILSVKNGLCSIGHKMVLIFLEEDKLPKKQVTKLDHLKRAKDFLELEGKVNLIEIYQDNEKKVIIEVAFKEMDLKRWSEFRERYTRLQEKLINISEQVAGKVG